MGYEIIYRKDTGHILLTRRVAAPRGDLTPGKGEDKLFLSFNFGNRPVSAYRVDPKLGTLRLREDFVVREAGIELALSSDAAGVSPIDGIPSIPADGRSTTTITVQKKQAGPSGRLLKGAIHRNLLNIRTTAGTASAQQVNLDRGRATFALRSSTETVVAEVRVWAQEIPGPGKIQIEFAPT